MREFLKENIVQILTLILISLLLIFGIQVLSARFSETVAFENIENTQDRIRCAKILGWQVDKGSEALKSAYIPRKATKSFLSYNEIQKMCGFDLEPYMGQSVKIYTYRILNFPSESNVNAFLNIIIKNGKVIGGDCTVEEYDELYLPIKSVKPDTHIAGGE